MLLHKQRLEALSDGVIAIIITIMVLNIPLPTVFTYATISDLMMNVFIYLISFIVIGFFWNQHHQLFSIVTKVSNRLVLFNFLFLFFLSLIPVIMKWVMINPNRAYPVIAYALVYLLTVISYLFLIRTIRANPHLLLSDANTIHIKFPEAFMWIRFVMTCMITLLLVFLTIGDADISSLYLLLLPVISSLGNVLLDHQKKEKQYE